MWYYWFKLSLSFDFKLNNKESFFINELKESGIISEYNFFVIYEDKENIFNYANGNNYGAIIIGDSPHILIINIKKKI